MSILELLLLAVGLSMDAFAVSVCKGLAMKKANLLSCTTVGLWFGGFQALMPLIGYFLGVGFKDYISAFDHWIAFALLVLIGANMIRESVFGEDDSAEASLSFRSMLPLAIATSIDALAVGVTFAFMGVNIAFAVMLIGITTFVISAAGVRIGNIFGSKYKKKAEIAGGVILVLLGIKILLEHLGVISF
jgi:putative Mn2+ efflux pump MntP